MATSTTTIRGWTFKRASEAYIDVYAPGNTTDPVDCINVFDYERGESDVPRTREALRKHGNTWLVENRDCLDDYIGIARYA